MEEIIIQELIGQVFTHISAKINSEVARFENKDIIAYIYCSQENRGDVYLADVTGDVSWLLNTPILEAFQVSTVNADAKSPGTSDQQDWTYYKFTTIHGTVILKFFGIPLLRFCQTWYPFNDKNAQ